ncbi:MAG TPA: ELWxxDGT repeat protein [Tepidisphaeraceae bacterium]|nr:ELWxxDGT repeat protein [Tepidisphaeraceae bacterium]
MAKHRPQQQQRSRSIRRPRRHAAVEALESRTLLAVDLVKDINPARAAVAPSQLTDVNGTLFLSGHSALWKSDGTASGTVRVGEENLYPQSLTNVGGKLFFVSGSRLWTSDGTDAGTTLVHSQHINPRNLTTAGGRLFFRGGDGAGDELWTSDGTEGGTVRLKDIKPGGASSEIQGMTPVGGKLYFHADDGSTGDELWVSDGTPNGTKIVKDILPGSASSEPLWLTNVNGTLFFAAHNAADSGYELWKSDGTEGGTVLVKDVRPGKPGSSPTMLRNFNGTLMFVATDGQSGYELWKSDGTEAGTVMVRDIVPGGGSLGLGDLTVAGNTLYFTAEDDAGGNELWKSDGTAAGTQRLKDILPGPSGSNPGMLTTMDGKLYFVATDGAHGQEIWTSDGTAAGTSLLIDTYPGTAALRASNLTASGSKLFYVGDDGPGASLWVSDGTAGSEVKLRQLTFVQGAGSGMGPIVRVGSTLYFSASDGIAHTELWKSDGTPEGTSMVVDLLGGFSSYPSELTNFGDKLYFTAMGKLWSSDGTAGGTVPVTPVAMSPSKLFVTNGVLYFLGWDGGGQELWRTDGTQGGTARVKDIFAGGASSSIEQFTNVGGTLYFIANDGAHGQEIWKSDGTEAGTVLVKDVRAGTATSAPQSLAAVGSTLFFRATDGGPAGHELWKSDGTAGGTALVKDIRPGSGSSIIHLVTGVGSTAYFVADDGTNGQELWKSDGTAAGTLMVRDLMPGSKGSTPVALTNLAGKLLFRADDGASGIELWTTDGTAGGTLLLKDIRPGAVGSEPKQYMNPGDGTLFFVTDDGAGYRLWRTDGTAAGTYMAGYPLDLLLPSSFTPMNGDYYFSGWKHFSGDELYKLHVDAPSAATSGPMTDGAAAAAAPMKSSPLPEKLRASAADSAALASPGDIFYDATLRSEKPAAVLGSGMAPIVVDYGSVYTDWQASLPDETRTRALARYVADLGRPLILDIEHWHVDGRHYPEAVVQSSLEKIEQVLTWIKDERPQVSVGMFGLLPLDTRPAPAPGAPGYAAWHAATERLRPLIDKVDVLYPGQYTWQPGVDAWTRSAENMLAEAALYGKPVRPFIWGQYHGFNGDWDIRALPADLWRAQLDVTSELADGAVFWTGGGPWGEIDQIWWTVTRDFHIDSTPLAPAAPLNLGAAPAAGAARIDLAWADEAYNEAGYRVERRTGNGAFTTVAALARNAKSYADAGLDANTTYVYRVVAVNAAGDSLASNEATATSANVAAPPAAPLNPAATALSPTRVQLTWTDASQVEHGFKIERAAGAAGAFAQVATVGAGVTSYTDSSLTAGVAYRYRVRAYGAAGNSAYTAAVSVTMPLSGRDARGHWALDENAGASAGDGSGAGRNGTLAGGAAWTGGTLGSAISFDGVDDRIVIPDAAPLRFAANQSFTASAWVKLSSLPGQRASVLAKALGSPGGLSIGLDALHRWVVTGTGGEIVGSIATTDWTHVAAVQDGPAGTRTLYVNGVAVGSGAAQAADGAGDLWIGGAAGTSEFFAGRVDDVRLFGSAWSAADVNALANPRVALAGGTGNDTFTVRLDAAGEFIEFSPASGAPFARPREAVASISVIGGEGDDRLILDFLHGAPASPYGFSFDGGAGAGDVIDVRGASASDDLSASGAAISRDGATTSFTGVESIAVTNATLTAATDLQLGLSVGVQGTAVLPASQRLPRLQIAGGKVLLPAGADVVLSADQLEISNGGSLDVANNLLLTRAALGTWGGAAFTGVTGWLASGRNGGAWNGSGIVTSMPAAASLQTSLAVVPASALLGLSGAQTALWRGQTVSASTVIVQYTYAGDADLNGRVDGDDYFVLDSHLARSASHKGWQFGDFDYNGRLNGDDYFLIDSNVNAVGL